MKMKLLFFTICSLFMLSFGAMASDSLSSNPLLIKVMYGPNQGCSLVVVEQSGNDDLVVQIFDMQFAFLRNEYKLKRFKLSTQYLLGYREFDQNIMNQFLYYKKHSNKMV